jgi:hypothetical protein
VPELEFTLDTASGELQLQVRGIAGPACDDIARLVKDLAGDPGREEVTADYHLRPRVHGRADAHVRSKRT